MVGYLIYHRSLQLLKHYNDVSHSKVKGQPHCNVIIFFLKFLFCALLNRVSHEKEIPKKNIYFWPECSNIHILWLPWLCLIRISFVGHK